MEISEAPPLMLCMEKTDGQEVALQIQPTDDFHTFLLKARSLLGYDIDLNSITHNQPVALTDNVYQFLLNCEKNQTSQLNQQLPTINTEDLYILDDGTQIRASQIHFDDEDAPVDLTNEKMPFVKYDNIEDVEEEVVHVENKLYNIVDSPVRCIKDVSSSLVIPFKLVSSNTLKYINSNITSGYEAQFTKYLEVRQQIKTYATLNTVTNRNKSPRSLIRENFKNIEGNLQKNAEDYTHYTREDILNMFKDTPVSSAPSDSQVPEKRRHSRKSEPSRLVHKNFNKPISYVDVDGVLIAESESQNCFICAKFVDNNNEKLYLFDNEDQRLHRSSPLKKLATQLKIICAQCLEGNFRSCRKSPNQSLNPDEYLVIRNNQQYIFQKINPNANFEFTNYKKNEINSTYKVELGSDGEVITQTSQRESDGALRDGINHSSSDVEIIENETEFHDVDNLEEDDEEVIEFLQKCQYEDSDVKELKCRFCGIIFATICEVIDHGIVHEHKLDDGGGVFPCPLCDYGYANFNWLKGHLNAAHGKTAQIKAENKSDDQTEDGDVVIKNECSPIARRTRSAAKTTDNDTQKDVSKPEDGKAQTESKFEIKTEVKQEVLDNSDEEIWIVQAADGADNIAKKDEIDMFKCKKCCIQFMTANSLTTHKCRRKRKAKAKDEAYICVPTQEDFIKRAQGRARNTDDSDQRPRKKKNKEPTSDPQIVTCYNCNDSFTSKVRLKFHMQFHDKTNMLTADGNYQCIVCDDKVFSTETALFDHVHFQHHKQSRWQCPIAGCGKTFYLRATLTKHSRTHTDTRRYVCGTCGKRFLDKQTLDEHGVTHLRIKPFQCHICLKQLTRRSRLRMHLRAHEEELRPRLVLVCAVCACAFRDPAHAQEHITNSPECIQAFTDELKEEDCMQVQLSPTSGLVRHTVRVVESPKLSRPIHLEVSGPEAQQLLDKVPDAALPIIRCVEIEKAFRCEFCEDVFYSEYGLNNHRVIHKNVKNPFTCHICKVSFATYSRCTTHKTTHGFYKRSLAMAKLQTDSGKQEAGPSSTGILGYGDFPVVKHFLCEAMKITKSDWLKHIFTHLLSAPLWWKPGLKHFLCSDCGRSYLHWTYLQVHRRMKHANDNFTHKCTQCDVSFVNSWSLSYHRKKQHGGRTEQEDGGVNSKTKEREDYRIPCRDCDEVLPNKTALYKHRKKEHSDMTLQMNNENAGERVAGSFWCARCGRRCGSRAALDAHACSPAPPAPPPAGPPAACPRCSQVCVDGDSLSAHLRAVHGAEPQMWCGVCRRAFWSRAQLTAHARTHAPAHGCGECGRAFRTRAQLADHARAHSGERPYPCDVCGVAFRRSTAMRNHRLIHSGVRAWACPRCPKRFRIRSDLRTHLRLKHPARLYVIEVRGLNPTPEEVMQHLTTNNIPHDKVIEITKMTFPKGVTSVVPGSQRALDKLSHVPRAQVACGRRPYRPFELYQPARRGRGISKNPRKPKILQRGDISQNEHSIAYTHIPTSECQEQEQINQLQPIGYSQPTTSGYPVALNVSNEDLSALNVQLLLRDEVADGGQMVRLRLDNMLLGSNSIR